MDRLPNLRIVSAPDQQGVSYARNVGLAAARGDFVAIGDDDDAAEPHWMTSLVAAGGDYDVVGGLCDRTALNDPRVVRTPLDSEKRLPEGLGHLSFAFGGNIGMWRSVAEAVGGWDQDFNHGCEDVDFSWRAQQAGFSSDLLRTPSSRSDFVLIVKHPPVSTGAGATPDSTPVTGYTAPRDFPHADGYGPSPDWSPWE